MLLKKQNNILNQPKILTYTTNYLNTLPITFIAQASNTKLTTPILFFLRTQRRYNKRRLAKARVYSRTSFYSSCSLGSIFIGLF
jgi:hypothetical protein